MPWKRIAIAAAGVFVAIVVLGALAGGPPDCDDPQVLQLAEKLIVDAPLNQARGVATATISNPGERSMRDGVRSCRGMLRTELGEEGVAYSVSWHGKTQDQIWVEIER